MLPLLPLRYWCSRDVNAEGAYSPTSVDAEEDEAAVLRTGTPSIGVGGAVAVI
jgi:hypothetical protein